MYLCKINKNKVVQKRCDKTWCNNPQTYPKQGTGTTVTTQVFAPALCYLYDRSASNFCSAHCHTESSMYSFVSTRWKSKSTQGAGSMQSMARIKFKWSNDRDRKYFTNFWDHQVKISTPENNMANYEMRLSLPCVFKRASFPPERLWKRSEKCFALQFTHLILVSWNLDFSGSTSHHQFMIFMVALPIPKQPKAAETSEDLQAWCRKNHTISISHTWQASVNNCIQFSSIFRPSRNRSKSDGKSQSLHLQTLWDQASYRVSFIWFGMTAMASFFGVVTLHSSWTSLSIWAIWTNL